MKALYALAAACVFAASAAAPASAAASTDLGVAASTGDVGRVKQLLAAGQNINGRDGEGYTPVMWAALNGQVGAVSTLITLGANLNHQDREGYTALMWAAQNKHATIVRQLLNAGASVNLRDSHGYTALHWAAQDGQLHISQMLLQRGADPNARDIEGYTPLMWAAQQGHAPVVYELLAAGANRGHRDRRGYTAYDLANAYYRPEIRKMIKNFKYAAPAPYWREAGAPGVPYRMPAAYRVPGGDYRVTADYRTPVDYRVAVPAAYRGYAPVAVVHPHRYHRHPAVVPAANVPVRSGVKPKLVGAPGGPVWGGPAYSGPVGNYGAGTYAVGTFGAGTYGSGTYGAPTYGGAVTPPTYTRSAWWGSSLEARLSKFDVDRNRVLDGHDWRNLTMTTSRIAIAQMVHDHRCGKRACPTHHVNAIMNKLDWVYNEAGRQQLTINQAWELPSYHFEQIRW